MRDPEVNHARYGAELEATLAHLRGREEATVTPVSGFIAEHFRTRRLFYTFNHPTNLLLFRVATLIAKSLGARSLQRFRPDLIGEKLGDILLPINPAVRPGIAGTVSDWTDYVGLRYLLTGTGVVVQHRERRFYGLDDLVQHFYRVYDAAETSAPQRLSAV